MPTASSVDDVEPDINGEPAITGTSRRDERNHMRSVDTDMLKALGEPGAGPWRTVDGRVLRGLSGGRPIPTEDEAFAMLEAYRAASTAAGTPQAHEVVRIAGGYGVMVDYVVGLGLGVHLAIGSFTSDEAGRAMGTLLRRLHGSRMEAGLDWNGAFRAWARALAPLLPEGLGERLVILVDAVAARNCLLHGDFHVGNVIVRGGRLSLIDMEAAGFGHPALDLAVARSRTLGNVRGEAKRMGIDAQVVEHAARAIWDGMLDAYFEGMGAHEREAIDRGLAALSEVERCCCAYGIAHPALSGMRPVQQERLSLCANRLADLLPKVERLDF